MRGEKGTTLAYSRWTEDPNSLYIWASTEGLNVWRTTQEKQHDGLFFKAGDKPSIERAETLFIALNDFLQANGRETKIRAGKLSIKKVKK